MSTSSQAFDREIEILRMNARHVIVIGTSAGNPHSLKELVQTLPSDLNATILVARHLAPAAENLLPELLQRVCQLEVTQAVNGEQLKTGHLYVAPPDYHMLVGDGRIILANGPRENRSRPAIDPLFRSAALAFGTSVVGVLLTGELDDGTAGLWCVKNRGGVNVVQDPNEASSPSMPRSALKHVEVDHCLPVADIGSLLAQLTRSPVAAANESSVNVALEIENRIALGELEALHELDKIGKLTHFTCPECHSPLRELRDGTFIRFRCRSGHANSAENLMTEQAEIIERFLRAALDETEENEHLGQYLSEHARDEGDQRAAEFFLLRTAENERRAHLIHQALENSERLEIGSLWESEGRDSESQPLLLLNAH